jgi:hypothetical protein
VMVASARKGKVTFTWNSALVSNGSHSIGILGFPKQGLLTPRHTLPSMSGTSNQALRPRHTSQLCRQAPRSLPRVPARR